MDFNVDCYTEANKHLNKDPHRFLPSSIYRRSLFRCVRGLCFVSLLVREECDVLRVGICVVVGYQVANLAVTTHVHSFFGPSIVTNICNNLCLIVLLFVLPQVRLSQRYTVVCHKKSVIHLVVCMRLVC